MKNYNFTKLSTRLFFNPSQYRTVGDIMNRLSYIKKLNVPLPEEKREVEEIMYYLNK